MGLGTCIFEISKVSLCKIHICFSKLNICYVRLFLLKILQSIGGGFSSHVLARLFLSAGRAAWEDVSVEELLSSLQLESLTDIFQREHISMDVLVEMTNEDLTSIGVSAFGHRHKILRRTKELTSATTTTEEEEMGT